MIFLKKRLDLNQEPKRRRLNATGCARRFAVRAWVEEVARHVADFIIAGSLSVQTGSARLHFLVCELAGT